MDGKCVRLGRVNAGVEAEIEDEEAIKEKCLEKD
jgi:hypothetical protein